MENKLKEQLEKQKEEIEKLKKKNISMPFCIIIPSELHFVGEEALDVLKEK